MNEMSKQWVVLAAFKLKEWYILGDQFDTVAYLYHKGGCSYQKDVDGLFLPEILDIIAKHECPTIYGERNALG